MRHFKKKHGDRGLPCAHRYADDGVEAKRDFLKSGAPRSDGKTQQLCRQVQRSLSLTLAGCADPVLQSILVVAVEPAPNAGRLRVIVTPVTTACEESSGILNRLEAVAPFLRRSVAQDIVRKRAPELIFAVLPGQAVAR